MSDPLKTLKVGSSTYEIYDDVARTTKQNTLVSGSNIKTINGNSILGSGNLAVSSNIPLGQLDATSTSTNMTATVSGITSLSDGVCVFLENGVVTSASGVKLNINNLGAKPIYQSQASATAITTQFNVAYTAFLIYDSTRVSGGCWMYVYGYDTNSNTIGYQLRTNSSTKPASDTGYRYRLWFTSADGTKFVPSNTSTSTNATAVRTPCTTPIDPWGEIVYYSTNGTTTAGSNLSTTTQWAQYTLSLGYSFNTTGSALTLSFPDPVYVKCTPQSNGSAVLEGYTQALPTTEDGYIYIFLGVAYSATNIELYPYHPVYYYKSGAIRLWTNAPSSVGLTATTATLTSSGWSSNTQTVTVSGVTATNTVIVSYAPSSKDAWVNADIYCSAQGANSLTFTCTTEPTVNVTANVVILT